MKKYLLSLLLILVVFLGGYSLGRRLDAHRVAYRPRVKIIKTVKIKNFPKEEYINFIKFENSSLTLGQAEDIYLNLKYYSHIYNIPFDLGFFITALESQFRPGTESNSSVGLMEINLQEWNFRLRKLNIIKQYKDYFKISNNIHSGMYILNIYHKRCEKYARTNILQILGYSSIKSCTILNYYGSANAKFYLHRWYYFAGQFFQFSTKKQVIQKVALNH